MKKIIFLIFIVVGTFFLFADQLGSLMLSRSSIVINSDGTVYNWGNNDYGQLGDNSTSERAIPVNVLKGEYDGTTYLGDNGSNKIIKVCNGNFHGMGLTQDGMVYTWGRNNDGQLGNNSTIDSYTPVKVLKGEYDGTSYLGDNENNRVIAIAGGVYHSVALTEDGSVYAWGKNTYGMLGNNSTIISYTPVKVLKGDYDGSTYLGDDSSNKIVDIAAGTHYTLALDESGLLYAWGYNYHGYLGNNSTTQSLLPVKTLKGEYDGTIYLGDDPNNKIISISASGHVMALSENSELYTWGWNESGQLGDSTIGDQYTPVRVHKGEYDGTSYLGDNTGNRILKISAGAQHSGVCCEDGKVYTWGHNNFGQLGNGSSIDSRTPVVTVKGECDGTTYLGDSLGFKVEEIALGRYHCLALIQNGAVFSWGLNDSHELGINNGSNKNSPVQVLGEGGIGELIVPIILSSFNASVCNGFIDLEWITESETENLGFIIEKKEQLEHDWITIVSYKDIDALIGHGSSTKSHSYRYFDKNVLPGKTYEYRLGDVNYDNDINWHDPITIDVPDNNSRLPQEFGINRIYPNPFNPSVLIEFYTDDHSGTELSIYNVNGHLVEKIEDINVNQYIWKPENISTGIYIISLTSGSQNDIRKIAYLK